VCVALANEFDAIERFDVCSRLLNIQVVDRHVVLGLEGKLFKTQKDFVEPNAGVLSQRTQVHLVKRWAVANQHGGFALVFVLKAADSTRVMGWRVQAGHVSLDLVRPKRAARLRTSSKSN
jgi:hypothetical protein